MTRKTPIILAATLGFLGLACTASAHHSTAAEFDLHKPVTFTGKVKKIQWMNPHIYTLIETKGANGKPVVYRVEGGPPNALFRAGWRMDTLKVGDTVTVQGLRAKNEASMNVGQATITTADGKKVFSGNNPARVATQ
jgi:hypothetical protein